MFNAKPLKVTPLKQAINIYNIMGNVNERVLAFDVGGTLVKLGIVDSTGLVLEAGQIETRAGRGGDALLAQLLDVARALIQQHRPAGVAFSTLGTVDASSGTILGASDAIPGYLGRSPKCIFESALSLPVIVENDGNCVAVAEGWIGAAKGIPNYIALTLGTGIGGGIVIGGHLHRGAHAAAGEWGYMIVDGKRWEDVASLRGLARLAEEAVPGCGLDAQRVFAFRDQGDPTYAGVVRRWLRLLATGLANLIYAFDPQRVIVGGGITARGPVFLQELQAELKGLSRPDYLGLADICLAAAGNSAGLLGAAKCWFQQNEPASQSSKPSGEFPRMLARDMAGAQSN